MPAPRSKNQRTELTAKGKLAGSNSQSVFSDAPKPPPNYFARREQYRLLILCAMLMLVLVMMNEVRKPEMWKWMWANEPVANNSQPDLGEAEPGSPRLANPQPANGLRDAPIDTLSPNKPDGNLSVDGFRAIQSRTPADHADESPAADLLPGITAELLATIEDNSLMRVAENEAWQMILGTLKTTTQAELESRSLGYVSFAQLFRQTDSYRGQVVTVRGTVRRGERVVPRSNDNGIDELFRWIVEPAGPSNAPIFVYTLENPGNIQLGDDLREEAKFAAICFKRLAYAAGDGTRIAPVLLAKTVTWIPRPVVQPVQLPSGPTVAVTLAGLLLLAAATAYLVYRNSIKKHPDTERARQYMDRGVANLDESSILPSVEESLRALGQRDGRPQPTDLGSTHEG